MGRPIRASLDISPLFHTTTSGIGTYLLELTAHLPAVSPQDRFSWFYCAPWRSGRRRPPIARSAHPLASVPPVPPRLLQIGWRYLAQPSLRYLARDPDIFHASHIWEPPLGRARAVVTFHDLTPLLMPDVHVAGNVDAHQRLLRFARQRAAGVLVDSRATREDLLSLAPELEPRTRVVHLAASTDFQPVQNPDELRTSLQALGLADTRYFLFTGTLEPRKNLSRLLEAYRSLDLKGEGAPLLVIAGPAGWGDESVQERAQRLGIAGRVIVTGPVARATLRYLMAGALAFIYPSLYEGFGIPPLEAMACGTPVVTSNVSSLPEVVGDAALRVDPQRIEDIAAAMLRLSEDAALRHELQGRGFRQASSFSWESTARQTADFYHWVLGSG